MEPSAVRASAARWVGWDVVALAALLEAGLNATCPGPPLLAVVRPLGCCRAADAHAGPRAQGFHCRHQARHNSSSLAVITVSSRQAHQCRGIHWSGYGSSFATSFTSYGGCTRPHRANGISCSQCTSITARTWLAAQIFVLLSPPGWPNSARPFRASRSPHRPRRSRRRP